MEESVRRNLIIFSFFVALVMTTIITACNNKGETTVVNNRLLPYVIQDNFFYTTFYRGISKSNLTPFLSAPGPFTLVVPTDGAFNNSLAYNLANGGGDTLITKQFLQYHILNGIVDFSKSPLGVNQPLTAVDGYPLYLTRLIKGKDTLTALNGVPLTNTKTTAANGLIESTSDVYYNPVAETLSDATAADNSLTILNAVLVKAGLLNFLKGNGPFTLFAPVNSAFQAFGINSVDSIPNDSSSLVALLKYHIFPGRVFNLDFVSGFNNAADSANGVGYMMASGQKITTYPAQYENYLGANFVHFNTITVGGRSNMSPSNIVEKDITALNGVIHKIDQVLMP